MGRKATGQKSLLMKVPTLNLQIKERITAHTCKQENPIRKHQPCRVVGIEMTHPPAVNAHLYQLQRLDLCVALISKKIFSHQKQPHVLRKKKLTAKFTWMALHICIMNSKCPTNVQKEFSELDLIRVCLFILPWICLIR